MGITEMSSDMRIVDDAAMAGNERAQLALDMYDYRIKKYIGAYAAAMNGVDAISSRPAWANTNGMCARKLAKTWISWRKTRF